jgi:hypothetical protein
MMGCDARRGRGRPRTYSSGREAKRAAGRGERTGGPDVVLHLGRGRNPCVPGAESRRRRGERESRAGRLA